MKMRLVGSLVAAVACLAMVVTTITAGDITSGPKSISPFDVKAITGDMKGQTFCYV
jgi:hypothetical protein